MQELKAVGYIDMTPTWQEILPSWKLIVDDAVRVKKQDQMDRFWPEMQRMAEAADNFHYFLEFFRANPGILNEDDFGNALEDGKRAMQKRRSKIQPVEEKKS